MTIDFACKKFELSEIIKCSLGLTKSDFKIMEFLLKEKKEFRSLEISKKLSLDLSNVQRSLKKLSEKEIILRSQFNLSNGGYIYKYKINNSKEIKNMILNIVNNWVKKVESKIERW